MKTDNCSICRRSSIKLFLKGDRCLSPKCAIVKRSYPPGQKKAKSRRSSPSEFGKELREKQNLKNWYNLSERQFSNYVKGILLKKSLPAGRQGGKIEDTANLLIQKLEMRLDNVIFRLGFASSHAQARQFVGHGHFKVNGRTLNIPSHHLKVGDKIDIRSASKKKKIFDNIAVILKKRKPVSWLKLDIEKLEAELTGLPTMEDAAPIAEISSIFEYYSR